MPVISNYDNTSTNAAKKKKTEETLAYDLAKDLMSYKLGKGSCLNCQTATLLHKLSTQIEQNYELLFKNLCNRLDLNEHNLKTVFTQLADEIIGTDINWGRIVVLYTFGVKVAQHFLEHGVDLSEELVSLIGAYMAGKSDWIRKAGGWDAFCQQFQDKQEENEKFWWNSLLCTTLGLGTIAAMLYAKS